MGRQLAFESEPWKVLAALRLVGLTVLAAVQGLPPARMTRGTRSELNSLDWDSRLPGARS